MYGARAAGRIANRYVRYRKVYYVERETATKRTRRSARARSGGTRVPRTLTERASLLTAASRAAIWTVFACKDDLHGRYPNDLIDTLVSTVHRQLA